MTRALRRIAPWSLAGLAVLGSQHVTASDPALERLDDVDASTWPGEQAEVSVAVDPFDASAVVAASMNLPAGPILVMSSVSAGASWRQTEIPMRAGAVIHADPMVAFDSSGRLHVAHIAVGPGNRTLAIEVSSSDDRGATWAPAIAISQAVGRDDKLALAVDVSLRSRYRDAVYVAWKWPTGGVYLSRSADRGRTFSRPRLVDAGRVSGLDLAVSDDGVVYLAFHDHPRHAIRVQRSTDGGRSFDPPVDVAAVRAGWLTAPPSHCVRGSLVHASLAVDTSSGAHSGRVTAAWSDHLPGSGEASCPTACAADSPCRTAVYLSFSDDQGRSWSPPVELPDRPAGADRYHQWIDVDPMDGSLYVAFKESGEGAERTLTHVAAMASSDGGATFGPPIRLSSESSDASGSSFQYGDYQGLAAVDGFVYAAWGDFGPAGGRLVGGSDVIVGRAVRR